MPALADRAGFLLFMGAGALVAGACRYRIIFIIMAAGGFLTQKAVPLLPHYLIQ